MSSACLKGGVLHAEPEKERILEKVSHSKVE